MHLYSAIYGDFHPFDKFYPEATRSECVHPSEMTNKNSVLIVWGGADIHPSFYGRPINGSHVGNHPSARDDIEYTLIETAIDKGIPIVGVCRGAQMLCAVAGGRLAQDVEGHGWGVHTITTTSGDILETSSVHHQMMYPYNDDGLLLGEILATCKPRSPHYKDLTIEEAEKFADGEPEIIWFPKVKGLGIQGHPEYMRHDVAFNKYIKSLMEKYIVS